MAVKRPWRSRVEVDEEIAELEEGIGDLCVRRDHSVAALAAQTVTVNATIK